jgi:hypothetical protein
MNVLFFFITTLLEVAIMTGQQQSEYVSKNSSGRPFEDFVSRWHDSNLSERVNEYSVEMDTLIRLNKSKPLRGALSKEGYFFDLISEIAKQGDFESLELLEKDIPPHWKYEFWAAVELYGNIDSAKKLLVKWAIENPTVRTLMKYHPNGVNLLIERAEDKRSDDRDKCLRDLAHMTDAIKVLDRIKALTSDQGGFFQIGQTRFFSGIGVPPQPETVGSVAAETVKELEAVKKLQDK